MVNDVEILCDVSPAGKKRDWQNKKSRSLFMADHHNEIKGLQKKAARMYDCGNVLKFKAADGQLKLYQAYFCKARLCPMCNWRRSLKIAYQNKRIVQTLNEREKVQWVFLTLTVKNVAAADLKNEMDKMTKSFNTLTRYVRFKNAVKGYFRALEVTKNNDRSSKSYGTYHPHFHVLLAVPTSYFQAKYYIKQDDWAEMWRKALKIDYKPVVYVQKVKPRETSLEPSEVEADISYQMAEQNAILEVSKYPVKDADILHDNFVSAANVETVKDLDKALAYKRLISYGGLLKELHKELNLDDGEDGDLVHVEGDSDEIANGALDVMAYWHVGLNNYVIKKIDD